MSLEIDLSPSSTPGMSAGLKGHLARPSGSGPWPGIVVVFEAFGVDEVGLRHVDRLAAAGYLTLMPDLYSQGGTLRCLVPTFRALRSGKGRPFADIEVARQWLAASPECSGKVAVLGFCMGGGFALLSAAGSDFDVSVVNYGAMPPKDLDAAVAGACPIVASYGGKDGSLKGMAGTLEAALDRAGVPHDVKEYPQAGHAFLNDGAIGPRVLRPLMRMAGVGPEPTSAADAWRRIEAFLAEHLR